MNKLCVISMSGGLDSTTLAMKALEDGYMVLPINIQYGQKNIVEIKAFQELQLFFKKIFPDQFLDPVILNLEEMAEQSLSLYKKTRDSMQVKDTTGHEFYTPSRNLVFASLASMIGEIAAIASNLNEVKIGLGIHKHSDVYSRDYWDITPEFVTRLNSVLALNDSIKVEIYAPYSNLLKSEIVKDAIRLGVPLEKTWTCYDPIHKKTFNEEIYKPCLKCEACKERARAGEEVGVTDINQYSLII